jgi:hypothetical protein
MGHLDELKYGTIASSNNKYALIKKNKVKYDIKRRLQSLRSKSTQDDRDSEIIDLKIQFKQTSPLKPKNI